MDVEQETKENYEKGTEWHIQKSLEYDVQSFIDKFVNELKSNKILEIGIGAGRDIAHFMERGIIVDGLDYSQKFINRCKSLYPNLKYLFGDVRTIELQNESYDGIWACASLLNMPKNDLINLLPKLRKTLQNKGIIFIIMPIIITVKNNKTFIFPDFFYSAYLISRYVNYKITFFHLVLQF